MWHVGQRVVCVDDEAFGIEKGVVSPQKGVVYTLRYIEWFEHLQTCGFLLCEILNKPKDYREGVREQMWEEHYFKPLDEKRLDIFREMLTVKEREKEIVE